MFHVTPDQKYAQCGNPSMCELPIHRETLRELQQALDPPLPKIGQPPRPPLHPSAVPPAYTKADLRRLRAQYAKQQHEGDE